MNSRISFKNAVRFSVQLLDGIEWIQQKGVVHADIKPDNCLINTNNNLVISDFGSAFLLKVHALIHLSDLLETVAIFCTNYLL